MTRDEEILNAARTRAERHQIAEMELYGGDKCNYSYGRIYFSEIASFEAGAKWADQHPNNVWHDASEEPKDDLGKDDLVIIYQDKHGDCWFITKRDIVILYINWECFATVSVRCWAYISDLLPKQFGNPEQLKGGEL